MSDPFHTILLLALPASGKSEVRKYIASLPADQCRHDFHMGSTVQLDDFPYVHFMRRVDAEMEKMGLAPVYFLAPDRTFIDPWDWGTLVQLVNEDYDDLHTRRGFSLDSAAQALFERIDGAADRAAARIKLSVLDERVRSTLATRLEDEAKDLLREKQANIPESLDGRTIVLEFARGGAQGAALPLDPPLGYAHALSQLSGAILQNAAILYVWVTPEESRRRNDARSDPNRPGSILFHGVPIDGMWGDYGCDDIAWLMEASGKPNTVRVDAHDRSFSLPIARFDNRVDLTSFVRKPRSEWTADEIGAIHSGLSDATRRLAETRGE